MSRRRYVTRTLYFQNVTAIFLDCETMAVEEFTIKLYRETAAAMVRILKHIAEDSGRNFVKIKSVEIEKAVYRMPESDFIGQAEVVTD